MWCDFPAYFVAKVLLIVSTSPSSFVDAEEGSGDGRSDKPTAVYEPGSR
jgi:hypothetical protein